MEDRVFRSSIFSLQLITSPTLRKSLGAVQRLESDMQSRPIFSQPRPGQRASGLCAEGARRRGAGRQAERRVAIRSRSAEAAN